MNLRERLQVRALVNLVISIIERLVNIVIKLSPKKEQPSVPSVKPERKKPLKKVIDTIDNIVPLPWRK
jgi:hypothetical protein